MSPLYLEEVAHAQIILQSFGFSGGAGTPSNSNYAVLFSSKSTEAKRSTSGNILLSSGALSAFLSSVHEPIITAISPATGYPVSDTDTITITGSNFRSGAIVVLRRTGESDIPGKAVLIPNATTILCGFDLAGKRVGNWNVVVTNTDTSSATLANGFAVLARSLPVGVALNAPNPFDPANQETTVYYNLDASANMEAFLFSTTGRLLQRWQFASGANGGTAGQNSFTWNGRSGVGDFVGNGVYLLHLLNRDTGTTVMRGKIAVLYL